MTCENCGTKLQQQEPQVSTSETISSAETNEAAEKVKELSSYYWAYFLRFLKNPTRKEEGYSVQFKYGIINIVIAIFLFSIALYRYVNIGYLSTEKFIFNTMLFIAVVITLIVLLIFVVNMFFSNKKIEITEILSMYGSKFSLIIVLNMLAFLFALMDVEDLTAYLLLFSMFSMWLLIPLFLVSAILKGNSLSLDAFYVYLVYIVLFFIAFKVASSVFTENVLARIFSNAFNIHRIFLAQI